MSDPPEAPGGRLPFGNVDGATAEGDTARATEGKSTGSRPLLRIAGAGALLLGLVAGGVAIGAQLWPRVVRVEQRVLSPATASADAARGIDALPDLVGRSCPAVVAIEPAEPPRASAAGNGTSSGSGDEMQTARADEGSPRLAGFLVSADGFVVTSAAALAGGPSIRVVLNDGRSFEVTRSSQDPVSGIALLKIDVSGLSFLQFADTSFSRVGDWGAALASPNGSGCLAEAGTISVDFLAERPGLRSYLRIRPALDVNLVGAPVLNRDGRVLGVAGLGSRTSGDEDGSRILPAGTAARIVSELLRTGSPAQNRFGIVADDLLPELAARAGVDRQQGAMISLIKEGSPAARAGLKAGDVILSAAGAPISGASELSRALDTGDRRVALDVLRRGRRITFNLAAAP